ncbi:hypothetical protein MAR_002739, partial [Mya arenaria]
VCGNDNMVYRWCSSPIIPIGVCAVNFQALASVTLAGNNFSKIALFSQFWGLQFPSSVSFYKFQNKIWPNGLSWTLCTYTIMNQADKKIIAMEVVDKRETNLKSGLMEAKAISKAIYFMLRGVVEVEEIVTDAHPQISVLM